METALLGQMDRVIAFKKDTQSIHAAREMLAGAKAVLLDWDGCVAFANRPSQHAIRFIEEWQDRVAIVSNNSTHQAEDFARILSRAGVHLPPERIILAGVETIKIAASRNPSSVLLLGDNRMKALARNSGLNLVKDRASLVVLLRDTRLNYNRLERAANCLKAGAQFLVANPDLNHRSSQGMIVPETGALLAALQACLGNIAIDCEVIGKPGPRLFAKACEILNVAPGDVAMIGDNPATDLAGAESLGMPSILIGGQRWLEFENLLRDSPVTDRSSAKE